ncbi:MAG TPA: MBL fold metallo-hydrolase [Candidatus Latescibacteria bacterium]|nr:MBL fold metallo-hydrolase [Candidatus Latescibacterota bacterium]
MTRYDEHIAWVGGTCSTYAITQADRTLLIDCGSLRPDDQQIAGVNSDRLLLTHFHRDQCGGAPDFAKGGVDVTIPFAERRFFEAADILRASYDTYDNYTAFFPGFSVLDDVRGSWAVDYDTLNWQSVEIQVVPLPGHTFGSTGYLLDLGGTRYLACGDLMSAPGKLHDYARAQWSYMSFQGHVNLLESLQTVRRMRPDVILPGHGEPFAYTDDAIESLDAALRELYELFYGHPYQPYEAVFRQLSDHVFEVTNSAANTYIVHDGDGHGLFIDCGYTSGAPIGANPHRFIDHLTPRLEEETGITQVEWFLPSHYHDDHLAGLPTLQVKYETQVACSAEVADIIEHPGRYDMPCLVPHATKVDRIVQRDEVFEWRGFSFRMEQFPGQTWYHHLISFEADDQKYLSIGDNISGLCFAQERDFIHSFIPKNRTPVSSYRDMPRQIRERDPHVLLTGHGGAVDCDPEQVARWQVWMDRWAELFEGLIDQPHPNMGMDPHWVEFYPYKTRVQPGDELALQVKIRNHEEAERECRLALRATGGATVSPEVLELKVAPSQDGQADVVMKIPEERSVHAWTIVADVTWNGHPLGELAEAIAWW